ncbi:YafY family protein [Orbaceae bacterium ac157xtp]
MRRADRLFQIIQFLRGRRLTTAQWLAERLEVSERTIYRDMQDLILSGVPIDSEAGVGYVLHKDYNLPPLMFDKEEIASLVIGTKMACALGGKTQRNAESALSKLYSVLPKKQQQNIDDIKVFTPNFGYKNYGLMIEVFHLAISQKSVIQLHYQKKEDTVPISRKIYPLGLFFWFDKWTLVAWCLLRNDFRHFRLDRIFDYQLTDQNYELTDEQTLNKFFSIATSNK